MDYSYWIKKWQKDKNFIVEKDIFKEKKYIYTAFPKANMLGFQNGKIRSFISCDILARYYRMQDKNVLFPTGCHTLCNTSFMENKKFSNVLNDDISDMYRNQLLNLGIGINENKFIDMRHNEYLANLQQAFIDLYQKGYIEYKDSKVYYDKKNNKIYDYTLHEEKLPHIIHKCFVLKIGKFIPQIIKDIDQLPVSEEVKNQLKADFQPIKKMELTLDVSNGSSLKVELIQPQYMGCISFIFLNPDFIDITDLVEINEYQSVVEYLEGKTEANFAFSGLYAKNPLTGGDIPIFISTIFNQGIYLGMPGVDEEDRSLAEENGLEIIEVLEDNVLIHSDFLDGMDKEQAKKEIICNFVEADLATVETIYENDEIVLSSLDNFGPLFPFLYNEDKNELFPLTGHLPYAFSSNLRPTFVDTIDFVGTPLNGTMNNLFTEGICPILSILYDSIGSIVPIFSNDAKDEYKKWNGIKYLAIEDGDIYSSILMPIIFYRIIQEELNLRLNPLFDTICFYNKVIDIYHNDILRLNNNLLDMSDLLNKYSPDAIRLFSMLTEPKEEFIFDNYQLKDIDSLLKKVENCIDFKKEDSSVPDYKLYSLIKEIHKDLEENNVNAYVCKVYDFLNNSFSLSKKEGLLLIRILSPICPFLAEEIFKNLYNSKYSILNESWPN